MRQFSLRQLAIAVLLLAVSFAVIRLGPWSPQLAITGIGAGFGFAFGLVRTKRAPVIGALLGAALIWFFLYGFSWLLAIIFPE